MVCAMAACSSLRPVMSSRNVHRRSSRLLFQEKPFGENVEGLFLFVAKALRGLSHPLIRSKTPSKIG
jgi:hypothetical protein